jgi:membrane protease YdiL (CAAX protease family)
MKTARYLIGVLLAGWLPYVLAVALLRRVASGWRQPLGWALSDLAPVLAALLLLIAYEQRSGAGRWLEACARLGLGRPSARALVAGLISALPSAVGLAMMLLRSGADLRVVQHPVQTLIRIVLAQALFEELLFRGFAFRRLSARMTFARAAWAAAAAFGFCHLGNFALRGWSLDSAVQIGFQVVQTTLLAFAPTLLVWRAHGLLWGACAWHLVLDLGILFPRLTPDVVSALPGMVGSLLTIPAAWVVGRILYPVKASR